MTIQSKAFHSYVQQPGLLRWYHMCLYAFSVSGGRALLRHLCGHSLDRIQCMLLFRVLHFFSKTISAKERLSNDLSTLNSHPKGSRSTKTSSIPTSDFQSLPRSLSTTSLITGQIPYLPLAHTSAAASYDRRFSWPHYLEILSNVVGSPGSKVNEASSC